MSKPKLALIPSGYKSGKVYSILPNDATGDFDFTRQSIGTRVRKDGLIEEAKTVGSITNELLYSEDYSQSNWAKTSVTVTTNQELAPDGTNTADKLDFSSSTSARMAQVINAPSGNYTFSVYLKSVSGSGDFRIRLQSGGGINLTVSLTEQWQRFDLEYYHSGGASLIPYIGYYIDASYIQEVYSWGAMVSEGALSDYIKTEGTTETKTVETFTDVPRLDWLNSNCPSLLLEPQRTNLQVGSEQFSNSSIWSRARGTAIADQQISPNGEYTADKILGDGTGTTYFYDGISFTSGLEYAISIFVKPINVTTFVIQNFTEFGTATFDIQNGTLSGVSGSLISQNIQKYGNGWYRCSAIYDCTSTGSKNIGYGIQNFNGDQFYLWGAQVEQGSYSTSYIKTEASTVTRLKDFISGGGNANLFNSLEGTFFVEMASFLNAQTNSNGIELTDSSGQNRVTIQYDTTNNQIRAEIKLANVQQAIFFSTSYDVTNFNKIAVTYKYNEAKLYINGSLISTDTSVNIFAEDTLTEVRSTIAGISSGAFNLQAKIKDLRVYDRVLTEAEAIELTTI